MASDYGGFGLDKEALVWRANILLAPLSPSR